MRTKTQTGGKESKEKAPGSGSSRSRSRGHGESEDEFDFRDYDENAGNVTESEPKKVHKPHRKGHRKGPRVNYSNHQLLAISFLIRNSVISIRSLSGTINQTVLPLRNCETR